MTHERVPEFGAILFTILNLLLHEIEPVRAFAIEFGQKVAIGFLQPPHGQCHEQSR